MAEPKPPSHLRKTVKVAKKAGWTYDMSGRNHPRLTPPPGTVDPRTGHPAAPVTFSLTPSDGNGYKAGLRDLRRLGLDV